FMLGRPVDREGPGGYNKKRCSRAGCEGIRLGKEEHDMLKAIIKRSGEKVHFDDYKIRGAILKANVANATEKMSDKQLDQLTQAVVAELEKKKEVPTVEQIQDVVEEKLIAADYAKTAKAYILYRAEHQKLR